MRWLSGFVVCAAAALATAASPPAHADPPGFHPLESPPGYPERTNLVFNDMTPDGRIVVGNERYSPRPLRWIDGAVEMIPFLPFPTQWASPNAITPDGSVIVGGTTVEYYPDALVWRSAGLEVLPRPDAPTPGAGAHDVSADGRIIVGHAKFPEDAGNRWHAARWVDGVLEPLPDPDFPVRRTSADFVSDDGTVIVGTALSDALGYQGVRWIEGRVELLVEPAVFSGLWPAAMSTDGRVVVGSSAVVASGGVRWEDGAMEALGDLPGGGTGSTPRALSGDGDLVFGTSIVGPPESCGSRCFSTEAPFVWTSESGMLPLAEWLRFGCGYELINWGFGIRGVSGDGSRLALRSAPSGAFGLRNDLVEIDHCTFDYEVPEWVTGPGDYYFADYSQNAIYRMRRENGEFEEVTSYGEINRPVDLEIGRHGELYVLSQVGRRIVRIDPATGEQATVAQNGLLDSPAQMALGADGTIYALIPARGYYDPASIVAIDPETGDQSLLSTGGWLSYYRGIARDRDGNLLTLTRDDDSAWWVVKTDFQTGEQRPLVALDLPTESLLGTIAWDDTNERLVVRGPSDVLLAVDVETGRTTVLSDPAVIGPEIEVGSAGDVLTVNHKSIDRVDAETGEVTVIQAWGLLDKPWVIQEVLAACSDRLDNDGDGLVDADDPGCLDPDDDAEIHRDDVRIDISPWDPENWIFQRPHERVVVAILGAETFDVRDLDDGTLAFGPAGAAPAGPFGGLRFDIDRDGFRDLLHAFRLSETGISFVATEACLIGAAEGIPFRACDAVQIDLESWCGRGFETALVLPLCVAVWRVRRRRP